MTFRLALAVSLLTLAACDLTADRPGEFEGTLTGAVTADLRWGASFGEGRGLSLSHDEGSISVTVQRLHELLPGRYALGTRSRPVGLSAPAATFSAGIWLRPTDLPSRTFVAQSGVLVLDAVSREEVRGSLTFTAINFSDSTETVEVSGRFRAEYIPFCC